MSKGKVNDDFQSQVTSFFQDFLPISKNTIKDTLSPIKALFRSEAGSKDPKDMHKKTLNGVFGRHFA